MVPALMKWKQITKIGAGLENLGNTCFLGASLQSLCYLPPFMNYLMSVTKSNQNHEGVSNNDSVIEVVGHVLRKMQQSSKGYTRPVEIIRNLKRIGNFRVGRQEDAHEFLLQLIDKLEQSVLSKVTISPLSSSHGGISSGNNKGISMDRKVLQTNAINRLFGGLLRSKIDTESHFVSYTFDPFIDLSLAIQSSSSVEKALLNYFRNDVLEDLYRNEKLKKLEKAKKVGFFL